MPTVADTKTTVDSWIAPGLTLIADYQATRGFPWQALSSHSVLPTHIEGGGPKAGDATPDLLANSPSDQGESWNDVPHNLTVQKWPAAVTISVYDGPNGTGYTVTTRFIHITDEYVKTYNFGPEAYRTHDWQIVAIEL